MTETSRGSPRETPGGSQGGSPPASPRDPPRGSPPDMPRGSPRRSLALSFLEKNGALIIRIASLAVLARLLPPAEFGIFAAASAAVALGAVLSDIGAQQYLIRAPELTLRAQRAALGLSLGVACLVVSAILAICVFAPEGWLLPEFRWTAALLCLGFLIEPFNAVATATLQRELRFGPLLAAGLVRNFAQAVAAIGLAAAGFGAPSLALAGIVEVLAAAIVLHRVRPLLRPSREGWGEVFAFGWQWAALFGLRHAGQALSQLMVSLMLGFAGVGLFSRALSIVSLFDRVVMSAIWPVVLPVAAEHRRQGRDLAPLYLRQIAYLSVVAWPFFAIVAVLAEPLVRIVLGPTWLETVGPVRILALGGIALPFLATTAPYFAALDMVGRVLPVQATVQALRVVLVAAGAYVSLELACAALVLTEAAAAWGVQRVLRPALGYETRDLLRALALGLLPVAACVAGAALALHQAGPVPPVAAVAIAFAAGAPLWLVALLLVRHPLAQEVRRLPALAPRFLRPRAS